MAKLLLLLEKYLNFIFDNYNKKSKENKKIRNKKILVFLFSPILYILEYIVYYHYWKKIIIPELLTNDNIVEFLAKNEFIYTKNSEIVKIELFKSNDKLQLLDLEKGKEELKIEFVEAIATIFSENSQFNISDYTTLKIDTELKKIVDNDNVFREKIYYVKIYFYRKMYRKLFLKYSIILTNLIILSLLLFKLFIHHII